MNMKKMNMKGFKLSFNFKSIAARIVLMFTAILLLMNGIFFFVATYKSTSSLEESIVSAMTGITDRSSVVVSERVQNYFSALQAIRKHHYLQQIHLYKRDINRLFTRMTQEQGHMDYIVADKTGAGYAGSGIELKISDRDYFKKVMSGQNAVSEPFRSPFYDNQLVIVFAVPIYDNDDDTQILGLVGIVRSGFEISELLDDVTYGENGYAFAVNRDGTIIGHPQAELVENFVNPLAGDVSGLDKSLVEHIEKMAARERAFGEYKFEGKEHYISYAPVPGTDWTLALTVPKAELTTEIKELRTIIIETGVILLSVGILMCVLMAFSIRSPIRKLERKAHEFAKGDLNVRFKLKRKDEIGSLASALEQVAVNMNELIGSIWVASEQVASGSKQISDSTISLSQGVTEQASSVEQLTASLEEMSAQTKQNAENADETSKLARLTETSAHLGNQKMQRMLAAMNDISAASKNINRVIKVIDDIAFQTNILALNAAVEAAHAGQHGKGFAVVADEVRSLATKSAEAARETSEMIENSLEKIKEGMVLAEETAKEFDRIVKEISKAAELVENISVASKEQSAGIEQISKGVMQVSHVIQANSATSQEVAAASEQLSGQAELLKEHVGKFTLRTDDEGSTEEEGEIIPEVLEALEEMRKQKKDKKQDSQKSINDQDFGKY